MEPLRPVEEVCRTRFDDRGDLTELVHCYDLPQKEYFREEDLRAPAPHPHPDQIQLQRVCQFGQVYVVRNEQAMVIRAFHRHLSPYDYFSVVNGKARFWVVNPELSKAEQFILSDKVVSRLVVPPRWWHGWQSLALNTILVCTGTEVYNRKNPDEERAEFDRFASLGVHWRAKPR